MSELKIAQFKYIELQYTDSIRLLKLLPGEKGSPLRCTLLEVRIGSLPHFNALSYTWGEPKFPMHIQDESTGTDIAITVNLFDAFEVLRQEQEHRLLWVDAVCINQADDIEKSKQVAMMSSIYQRAHTVEVWLGRLPNSTFEPLAFLGSLPEISKPDLKLATRVSFPQFHVPVFDSGNVDFAAVASKSENLLSNTIIAGVGAVFASTWFTRVWTVQEYILAQRVRILFGNEILNEGQFKIGVEYLIALMKAGGFRKELENVNKVFTLICHRIQFALLDSPGFFVVEPKNFFEMALLNFRDRDCYDERDRVFGFLALGKGVTNIVPDYTKTIEEVYTESAIKNLNFTTLFQAGLCRRVSDPESLPQLVPGRGGRNNLPSWCPDLRRDPKSWNPMFGNYFATSNSITGRLGWSRPNPINKCNVLLSYGLGFDSVQRTEPRNRDEDFAPNSDPKSFFTIINHLNSIRTNIAREMLYPNREFIDTALGITLACGLPTLPSDFDAHPLKFLIKRDMDLKFLFNNLWLNYLQDCVMTSGIIHRKVVAIQDQAGTIGPNFTDGMTSLEVLSWAYHEHLAKLIRTHDVFRTTNGYFGLSPPGTQTGDLIAMLSGHRTPFLIRKAPVPTITVENCCVLPHHREEGGTVDYYEVLGPCYVHGIMHGELYQNPVWRERFPWMDMEVVPGTIVPLPATFCHLI